MRRMSTGAAPSLRNQYRWLTCPAAIEIEPKSKKFSLARNETWPEGATPGTAAIAVAAPASLDVGFAPGLAARIATATARTTDSTARTSGQLIECFGARVALRVMTFSR